jgi:hypothetical protein
MSARMSAIEGISGTARLLSVRLKVAACDLPDKFDDASPQPWRLYPHERLSEREPVGRGEELRHISGPRRLSNSIGLPRQLRCAFEEERHRDLQDMGDVLQAARADAILSILIFLHLLPRQPEVVAELLSAHSEHHPAHPDPAAHVFVDGIRGPFDH